MTKSASSQTSIAIRLALLSASVILLQAVLAAPFVRRHVDKDAQRRVQHALTGHALVQISYALPYSYCLVGLVLGTIATIAPVHLAPDAFYERFAPLLRDCELPPNYRTEKSPATTTYCYPAAFYFLLGTLASEWIAGPDHTDLARYAVECLAVADPMASWIGSRVPSPLINRNTSLAGSLACFVTAWPIGWILLSSPSAFVCSMGALACTLAEACPIGQDNLIIPIVTTTVVKYLTIT